MGFPLGYAVHGGGPRRVVVLHDWLGDRRNYDPVLPYLDTDAATWAFLDLRGYGESRGVSGTHTATEAAGDAIALADHLGWDRFAAVGHSMSSLIVQKVAALARSRLTALVAITPVGPGGLAMPDEALAWLEKISLDLAARPPALVQSLGERLSPRWHAFKVARWAECSDPVAVRDYARMFARTELRAETRGLDVPILAITGEHDQPWFREEATRAAFAHYPRVEVTTITNAGHYPMQETPVALATAIDAFLARI